MGSAYWDPIHVAHTGRDLKIHSDARYRFERGVDPEYTLPGLEAATRMILELCGGEASEVVEAGAALKTAAELPAGYQARDLAGRQWRSRRRSRCAS